MTKQKSTKKTLLTSVLSLILCMAMLIGTTFAWFTDSVTSTNNKIQAGNLKIDLELLDKESGKWNSIKNSDEAIFDYNLWEPGYTDVKILKVENEGNLALKWMAKFISENELTALANVIDVYVCPSENELAYPADRNNLSGYVCVGTVAEFVNTIETTTTGTLKADETAYLGIALKMREEAGNEYQGMDLGGAFDIMVMATQLTAEEDSFDDQYDKDATYTAEIDQLKAKLAAAQSGETVEFNLTHDAYVDSQITVPYGVTLVLNGNGNTVIANTTYLFVATNANIKMNDMTIVGSAVYAIYTKGASWENNGENATVEATFTNVTVDLDKASSFPVVFNGSVSVKGSTFDGDGKTLTVTNASTTWDCAVHTTGGTIKNVKLAGAMRGIFMGSATADVFIDNVSFDTVYTFNSDGGNKEFGVYISNSTMNGWTSYSNVHKEVVFDNCDFTKGNGYAFLRAYNDTEFKNCRFDASVGFEVQIMTNAGATFENCYYGDTLITAENIATLGLLYNTDISLVTVK